ncbi:hypothetical protein [Desulfosporosinus sp. Sb-LF]|uniref:hypothetical protein n=1 Tax=Desulfosporosinus sp. Sb-LF TaxID=2560027 RepID=UPI00107FC07E|nr:hypothetical protein [Desulfosporosinus sp. Sb-LF]TGE32272.1 hypothetical protein E4K68_11725 [Desulfosporosinus sp. Sb-LF]
MNFAFWRYQLLLTVLFLFWGGFFVTGGALNQIAFNFAVFYPLGFLVGYRPQVENERTAFLAALLFNLLSYVVARASAISIQSWIVVIDYMSLFIFLKAGLIIGHRAQSKE